MTTYAETAAKKTLTPDESKQMWAFVQATCDPQNLDNVLPMMRPAVEALIRTAPFVHETDVEIRGSWPTQTTPSAEVFKHLGHFIWFGLRKDCDNFCMGEDLSDNWADTV